MKFGVVFNTESAFWYVKDSAFRAVVDKSDFLICDGAPLALAAKANGVMLPRYHGPDLMDDILKNPSFSNIYLLGGSPEAHDRIKTNYAQEGRNIEGDTSFFSAELPDQVVQKMRDARPDVIFVCLGLRKQERVAAFISKELADLDGLVIGVGAAVDFLGGTKVRSGPFFQRLGLEWLPRMIREPRMFSRNFRAMRSIPMLLAGKVQIIRRGQFANNLRSVETHLRSQ